MDVLLVKEAAAASARLPASGAVNVLNSSRCGLGTRDARATQGDLVVEDRVVAPTRQAHFRRMVLTCYRKEHARSLGDATVSNPLLVSSSKFSKEYNLEQK